MDTNMTFRMDSEVKTQMADICDQLGITVSTAFNIFANAFVRCKGLPFPVTLQAPAAVISQTQMLEDTGEILKSFTEDYRRMAE